MPIDPATLVRSLAPLTDLDPVADLASTLDLGRVSKVIATR
jgi:hypothetical protein